MPTYGEHKSSHKAYKSRRAGRLKLKRRKAKGKEKVSGAALHQQDDNTATQPRQSARRPRPLVESSRRQLRRIFSSDEEESEPDTEGQANHSDSEWIPGWATDPLPSDSDVITLLSSSESEGCASEAEEDEHDDAEERNGSDDEEAEAMSVDGAPVFDASTVAGLPFEERLAAWLAFHAENDLEASDRIRLSTKRAFHLRFEPAPPETVLADGSSATYVLREEVPGPAWYPDNAIASDQPCFRCRLLMQTTGNTSTCQCLVPSEGTQCCLFCTVRHDGCDWGGRQVLENSPSPPPGTPVERVLRSEVRQQATLLAQLQHAIQRLEQLQVEGLEAFRGWAAILSLLPPALRFKRLAEVSAVSLSTPSYPATETSSIPCSTGLSGALRHHGTA